MKLSHRKAGFTLIYVLSIGVTLLILGTVLFKLVGRHQEEIRHVADAQSAHYLAEAGIGFAICEVRKSFEEGNTAGLSPLAKTIIENPSVPETSIVPLFDPSWNYRLAACAAEVDPSASLEVDAWFTGFQAAETDPAVWNDPVSCRGSLAIRATGSCKGVSRTVEVRRPVFAGSLLPPVTTKFTLRAHSAAQGQPERYNTLSNDYDGRHVEGDRPLMLYHHPLPDDTLAPQVPKEGEEPANVFESRGWVWLGGGQVRLHLTSGALDAGELFQLYAIPEPGKPKVIRFTTPPSLLPPAFSQARGFPWDRPDGAPERVTEYAFGHDFLLDGFHDRSTSLEHNAMYEGDLISPDQIAKYGAKSSSLHLFGDCRKGFQSRTKVIGNVSTAILRLGRLDVKPEEPDVAAIFGGTRPSPQYFLPACETGNFKPEQTLTEFLGRAVGGPVARRSELFPTYEDYTEHMCSIVEFPTAYLYNFMGELALPSEQRTYPPAASPLAYDDGSDLQLRRNETLLYRGPVKALQTIEVIRNRAMVELSTIDEFWERFYRPDDRVLRLDTTVRIINKARDPLVFPPSHLSAPLVVEGSGMILFERGNVVCRGNRLTSQYSAITIAAPEAETVTMEQSDLHQLNILAPKARLVLAIPCRINGSVDVRDTLPTAGTGKGGSIAWREIQDPIRTSESGNDWRAFIRACVSDTDRSWYD